jgi:hypothetical protein
MASTSPGFCLGFRLQRQSSKHLAESPLFRAAVMLNRAGDASHNVPGRCDEGHSVVTAVLPTRLVELFRLPITAFPRSRGGCGMNPDAPQSGSLTASRPKDELETRQLLDHGDFSYLAEPTIRRIQQVRVC